MSDKRCRIVLADDEDGARETLGRILRDDGYEVALAADGEEALRLVAVESPDVLLIDLRMLEKDGDELLTRVQHSSPDLAVVIMTAHGASRSAVLALRRAVILARAPELEFSLFPVLPQPHETTPEPRGLSVPGASLEEIERDAILRTLAAVGGSTSRAARVLKISPRTIQYKLKQYRSDPPVSDSRPALPRPPASEEEAP